MGTSSPSSSRSASSAGYASLDSTYTSLVTLLSSPSSSASAHLALLPPAQLYASLTLYLARLPEAELPEFVKTLKDSRSFWGGEDSISVVAGQPDPETGRTRIHEDVTSQPSSASGSTPPSLLSRAYQLHLAAARAVFTHVDMLLHLRRRSTGWGTQRALRKWVDQVVNVLHESQPANDGPLRSSAGISRFIYRQLPRLAMVTGLVVGLSAYHQQYLDAKKSKQAQQKLDVRRTLQAAEAAWIKIFEEVMTRLSSYLQTPEATSDQASPSPSQASPTGSDWESEYVSSKSVSAGLALVERGRREESVRTALLVPLHLAAQASTYLSDRALTTLAPEPILTLIPLAILPLFRPSLFDFGKMEANTIQARTPQTHALFPFLGPLSRLLAAAGENAVLRLGAMDVERLLLHAAAPKTQGAAQNHSQPGALLQILALSAELQGRFVASGLGSISPSSLDAAGQQSLKDVWQSLKSFLFLSVQFCDSLLDGVIEILPTPCVVLREVSEAESDEVVKQVRETGFLEGSIDWRGSSNVPPYILKAMSAAIAVQVKLAFVTFSSMGPSEDTKDGSEAPNLKTLTSNEIYNRFTAYRRVFYGSLEVLKTDPIASTALVASMINESQLPHLSAEADGSASDPSAQRPFWLHLADLTTLLDASEQLVSVLPTRLIETALLPLSRPYLSPQIYSGAFESAHSFLLSLYYGQSPTSASSFSSTTSATSPRDRLARQLVPFYIETLMECLSHGWIKEEQFGYAVKLVVGRMSDVADEVAYYVVERLKEARDRIVDPNSNTGEEEVDVKLADITSERREPVAQTLELTIVDVLPYLNLVLLRNVLDLVRGYILQAMTSRSTSQMPSSSSPSSASPAQGESSSGDGSEVEVDTTHHLLLCRRTFDALNQMDDTARQEGVRWWVERREEFGI